MNKASNEGNGLAPGSAIAATEGSALATALWEGSGEAWLLLDGALNVVAVNPPAAQLLGKKAEDIVGGNLNVLLEWPTAAAPVQGEAAQRVLLRHAEGGLAPADLQIQPFAGGRFLARVVDRTSAEKAEATLRSQQEQLAHLQRNEVAARLVSGYVHDLNNQLTAIVGFGSLLRETIAPEPEHLEAVDCLLESGEHAQALTQRLLAVTRRRPLIPGPEDVNRTLTNMLPLAQRILGRNIKFVPEVGPHPARVCVYPGHVEQTLWNLLLNAKEAMEKGGRIELRSLCEEHDGASYCGFEVKDTGVGIPKSLHEKIFMPFFTTKPQGSGLGLSVVKDLVSEQGGRISVKSDEGQGACFRVLWPTAVPSEPVNEARTVSSGRKRALLIDHDVSVRSVLERALASMGMDTMVPPHDVSRQWWLQAIPRPSLAIVDVSNGASGQDLLAAVRSELPEVPIIALTDPHQPPGTAEKKRDLVYLAKPFSLSELGQKIEEVS